MKVVVGAWANHSEIEHFRKSLVPRENRSNLYRTTAVLLGTQRNQDNTIRPAANVERRILVTITTINNPAIE